MKFDLSGIIFGIIFLLLITACTTAAPQQATTTSAPPPPPTPDPALVASGEALYAQHCAECHGENLEGEAEWQERDEDGSFRAPPHDASGHTWHHSDRALREAILQGGARLGDLGNSDMPAYAGILSDQDVEAVLTYIKSTWPQEIRAVQWEVTVNDPGPESGN